MAAATLLLGGIQQRRCERDADREGQPGVADRERGDLALPAGEITGEVILRRDAGRLKERFLGICAVNLIGQHEGLAVPAGPFAPSVESVGPKGLGCADGVDCDEDCRDVRRT